MEQKLGRKLDNTEQVHHRNEDVTDNDPDNLTIELLGEHQRMHSTKHKYQDIMMECAYCHRMFLWSSDSQRYYYRRRQMLINKRIPLQFGPFCSKYCSGSFDKLNKILV